MALLISGWSGAQTSLLSPDAFLPYRLGDRFTPHHLLTEYFEHAAAARSAEVNIIPYGMTNEYRPLIVAVVSSKENMARIEDIRKNNLRRTGLLEGKPVDDPVAIVWLSFSVHGNESSGSESSMQVLYDLLTSAECAAWLQHTVVVIDPSLNPDGYNRYTNWNNQVSNRMLTPDPQSREHREPWPGGRSNHYYFDLNRDWAWQTQVESQQRAKLYLDWMPHVHADLHEMGANESYYFAPAAAPYHEFITDFQSEFQIKIGQNNARHFDENGWLYFTKEIFDLLYPSYGDTYPTFSGAIGMTYEQGGLSRPGRGMYIETGDTLRLSDRIQHHRTAALSTVEVSAGHAKELVQHFVDFFRRSNTAPPGQYKTYIIRSNQAEGDIKAFCTLLDKNRIRYGLAGQNASLKAFNYATAREENITVAREDLVVSAYQPMGLMAQALLDPAPILEDSMTYDITAWNLICAFGLEAYASSQQLAVRDPALFAKTAAVVPGTARPYAYLAEWKSLDDARFLSKVLQKGIVVRCAKEPFMVADRSYGAGTLIITRADNADDGEDFDAFVQESALLSGKALTAVSTGFVTSGRDLGSGAVFPIRMEKVLLLYNDNTDENAMGHLWHYFEQEIDFPLVIAHTDRLGSMRLSDYQVVILPNGYYENSDQLTEKLKDWVSAGGKLIALEGSLGMLAEHSAFKLKRNSSGEADKSEGSESDWMPEPYGGKDRRSVSQSSPGAIIKAVIDPTHPLGFGFPEYYYTLTSNSRPYGMIEGAWNVAYIPDDYLSYGFIGAKIRPGLARSFVVAEQRMGRGTVVYFQDNPVFRGFWHTGKRLLANALFLSGH